MKIQKIRNRSILFSRSLPAGWDLNVHLILGNKNNYLIDTGLGSSFIAPIKEYMKNETKPLIVINTHYHWDHIWGNSSFPDSLILSHKLCRDLTVQNWEEMMEKNKKYMEGDCGMRLPALTFNQELYFPEDEIRIMYTPGHSVDSISVLDEADKVLNAADNIGDSMEYILPSLECEKDVFIQTLMKYKEMDFEACISGHNQVMQKDVLDLMLDKL